MSYVRYVCLRLTGLAYETTTLAHYATRKYITFCSNKNCGLLILYLTPLSRWTCVTDFTIFGLAGLPTDTICRVKF